MSASRERRELRNFRDNFLEEKRDLVEYGHNAEGGHFIGRVKLTDPRCSKWVHMAMK